MGLPAASTTPSLRASSGPLQTELLDRSTWPAREDLANAIFSFVEGFYNPRRRHSTLGYLSPADYETQHALRTAADPTPRPLHDQIHPTPVVRASRGSSFRSCAEARCRRHHRGREETSARE